MTQKDVFSANLVQEKNQLITRLSIEKGKLVERLRDEYTFNQNKLTGEYDSR